MPSRPFVARRSKMPGDAPVARRATPLVLAALLGLAVVAQAAPPPPVNLPAVSITAADLAVVVNDADPESVELGRYYAAKRGIPRERVLHVAFAHDGTRIAAAEFLALKARLDAITPPSVQVYALAWTKPWRVECMSVTAAFAFGFDPPRFCAEDCRPTAPSPYFASDSTAPFTDHRVRPSMLLAGRNLAEAKAVIDRGVRSDDRWPAGKAYLMSTSDGSRNVRAAAYERVQQVLEQAYPIVRVDGDVLSGRADVMFYFTGLTFVNGIETNTFLDGAVADHLTSIGGALLDGGQMSALEWLRHGATGSYGTVVEPCNFRAKFPDVGTLMQRYLGGETLIEAYWKSVLMPGQGLFIGEPLARPFGGVRTKALPGGALEVETRSLRPGRYVLQSSPSAFGPFKPVGTVDVLATRVQSMRLAPGTTQSYRLVRLPPPPRAASAAGSGHPPQTNGGASAVAPPPSGSASDETTGR